MKLSQLILLAACLALALSGVVPLSSGAGVSNPVNPNNVLGFLRFNSLDYCETPITVNVADISKDKTHTEAHKRFQVLYPYYVPLTLAGCKYSTLGRLRYYSFTVNATVGSTVVQKEAKTTVEVVPEDTVTPPITTTAASVDQTDGYTPVTITRTEEDPTVSIALKTTLKNNWRVIGGNPLVACWERCNNGVWSYRFYFKTIPQKFEYKQTEPIAVPAVPVVAPVATPAAPIDSDTDFSATEPVYAEGSQPTYNATTIEEFSKHPAATAIKAEISKTLGDVKPEWISTVSQSSASGTDYFKIGLNFQPLLLKQNYEAHFFGSTKKAALLKIDESTFSDPSFEKFQEVKNFDSLPAFHEASEFAGTQFTWLRFYKVTAAYTATFKTGRKIRIVYQGTPDFVDKLNQVNIVVFIDDCGRYYIDSNDFLATNLYSAGRTSWVSLFVQAPDVKKVEFYPSIVNFLKTSYKGWDEKNIVDIKFKDNIHVVQYKNLVSAPCVGVLDLAKDRVVVLNKFNWVKSNDDSSLLTRLYTYVGAKKFVTKIMFVQTLSNSNGVHYEVGYLDTSNKFSACYVRYIPVTNVFIDDEAYHLESQSFASVIPLPKDIQGSVVDYLSGAEGSLVAIVNIAELSNNCYTVVATIGVSRWQITLEWFEGKWRASAKQPYNDGYSRAQGALTSSAYACNSFLKKIYPNKFKGSYLIAEHSTKKVGALIYNRIILDFGTDCYESVVKLPYGLSNSHVLDSWKPVVYIKRQKDYGYGVNYDFDYGIDRSYFYEADASIKLPSLTVNTPVTSYDPSNYLFRLRDNCPANCRKDIRTGQCVFVFGL